MSAFYLDLIAIGVILLTSIIGMYKGFFASFLALLGFVGTFLLSYFCSDKILILLNSIFSFTDFLQGVLGSTAGRVVAVVLSFIITYLLIKLVVFILNHTIGKIFKGRALGGVNKFMGFILGTVKGVAYVAVVLVVLNIASLIPKVNEVTTPLFAETIVIGTVYNWVGNQLGSMLANSSSENSQQSGNNGVEAENFECNKWI